ncbi:MAG TPA: ethylbenzene dehydrogenase-related protein [Actinomycetota bacterium]|nr:ethylbenzene dehydrogenase-related protein [Actinomycetota bacterium]
MSTIRIRLLASLALAALVVTACTGTAPSPSGEPSSAEPTPGPSFAEASATEPPGHGEEPMIAFTAASATMTVDGDASDWSEIEGATVNLEQIRLENLPPAVAAEIDFGPVDPVDVTFKVASDDENLYVILEVPGAFVYDAANHNLSASIAVMFRIDPPAAPHMGAEEPELDDSLGMVDIWHWELDCAAGETSGGGTGTGDDPECNLDDEYSTTPERREDDGGGDVANADAENTLVGVWEHSARASGAGADGTWIFEMSRPLQTGDPQDAQFAGGGTAHVALAFFDPTEGAGGWTDAGHLQSAYNGWIEVTLE